jgi:hypothetical protein
MLKTKITKIINHLPKYSYLKFLLSNPKASKEERKKAIKHFLDSTRK